MAARAPFATNRPLSRRCFLRGLFYVLREGRVAHSCSCRLGVRFLGAWWVELMLGLKFLAALVSLTLDSLDVIPRTGLYVGSVSFIGVDVHGQFEARIHSH